MLLVLFANWAGLHCSFSIGLICGHSWDYSHQAASLRFLSLTMASLICFAGIQTTNKLSFSKQSLIIQETKDTSLGDSSIPKGWEWNYKYFSGLKPKLANVLSTTSHWSKSSPDSRIWQMDSSSFWDRWCSHMTNQGVLWDEKNLWLFPNLVKTVAEHSITGVSAA